MSDLPQHAAQVATWRALASPAYPFSDHFFLNWMTPYLLGYALTRAAATFLPIVLALKVVISLALAAIPFALARLLRRTGGDPIWAIAMAPLAYTMTFYWGFLNFLVATPIALLFIERVYWYLEEPTRRRGAWLALFACLLYFCHVLILVFSCMAAGLVLLGARVRWTKLWPVMVPAPFVIAWFFLTRGSDPVSHRAVEWHWETARFIQFPSEVLGLSGGFDYAQLGCALGLCALPILMGARVKIARLLPALLVVVIFFTLPFTAFGTSCLYPRFSVFFVPLALMAFVRGDKPRVEKLAPALGLTLVLASMLTLTLRFRAFDEESQDFRAVLDKMEPGRTALSLVYLPVSRAVAAPVYAHFGMWYQAEKGGLMDPSFAAGYPQLVRYRKEVRAPVLGWLPHQFRPERHGDHDYFLARAPVDIAGSVLRDVPIVLVENRGAWSLYQRIPGH